MFVSYAYITPGYGKREGLVTQAWKKKKRQNKVECAHNPFLSHLLFFFETWLSSHLCEGFSPGTQILFINFLSFNFILEYSWLTVSW